jgi:hypothetical protein
LLGKEANTLSENFQSNHDRGHCGWRVELGGLLSAQGSGYHHDLDLLEITVSCPSADSFNQKARSFRGLAFFLYFVHGVAAVGPLPRIGGGNGMRFAFACR